MVNLQPDKDDKSGTKKKLDFMDKIMGVSEAEPGNKKDRGRIQEEDVKDDGYDDWKEAMLMKAVMMDF